jgi:cAMP phosphodiesterase
VKIRVLGASGSEVKGRYLTGFLIDQTLLLDPGSATAILTLDEQARIENLLLSHGHLDHVRDIPFLADNLLTLGVERPLIVWGLQETIDALRRHIFNEIIWPDFTRIPSRERPVLIFKSLEPMVEMRIGEFSILPVPVAHSLPAAGFIISKAGDVRIGYSGDTGSTDLFWQEVRNQRVKDVIVEVSFPDRLRDVAEASGHYAPSLLMEDLRKYRLEEIRCHITHMKPQFMDEIREELTGRIDVRFLKSGDLIEV